jgi:hypothetical protein
MFLNALLAVGFLAPTDSVAANRMRSPTNISQYNYKSGDHLRSQRRVAIGLDFAGLLGSMGTHLEMNFTPQSSFLAGYGGSPLFRSFALQYRRYLGGASFQPYIGIAYARWYNSKEANAPINETEPSILKEKFLSPEDAKSGKIAEDLLVPSIGIQFVQLSGQWSGFGLGAEVLIMMDIADMVLAPTGQISSSYYF